MTYTVYNTQDSASYESGLTLGEASKEFWDRNGGSVRDYSDALYMIVTDQDFEAIHGGAEGYSVSPVKPCNWSE